MCELMALNFNRPVNPRISFSGFRRRGKKNPDGWGIAMYQENAVQIIKEAIEAGESELSLFLTGYPLLKCMTYIFHVRWWPYNVAFKNTHPFQRELFGKDYCFAHNGSLNSYRGMLPLGRFMPIGQTDSEYAFCSLLHCIEEREIQSWDREHFEWLSGLLKDINSYGYFNCIFSNGEFLFCYHDCNSYRGLNFLHRKPPYGIISFADREWGNIDLSRNKEMDETGFLIATEKMTRESWHKFRPGELIVFTGGKMIYSSSRNTEMYNDI